jgi:hypothetical protein
MDSEPCAQTARPDWPHSWGTNRRTLICIMVDSWGGLSDVHVKESNGPCRGCRFAALMMLEGCDVPVDT